MITILGKQRAAALVLLGVLAWAEPAPAQMLFRFANRAQPELYLHIERGRLEAGRIEAGWWSAMWSVEPTRGDNLMRWRNRWKPNVGLELRAGEGAWALEVLENGAYFRMRSGARPGEYLTLQGGRLLTAAAAPGDRASHWQLLAASEPPYGKAAAAGAGPARRARNAAAGDREWVLERVADLDFYRVRDEYQPNFYYHIESGPLELGRIQLDWWSAQWKAERIAGSTRFRLQNRWKPGLYLILEGKELASGAAQPGHAGANWEFVEEKPAPGPNDAWHGRK